MNSNIFKVGENSSEKKAHRIAHRTKLSDKVVYLYRSFSPENTPLFFFYQKLFVCVYSTSEADTIVMPICLLVLTPAFIDLMTIFIKIFLYTISYFV